MTSPRSILGFKRRPKSNALFYRLLQMDDGEWIGGGPDPEGDSKYPSMSFNGVLICAKRYLKGGKDSPYIVSLELDWTDFPMAPETGLPIYAQQMGKGLLTTFFKWWVEQKEKEKAQRL